MTSLTSSNRRSSSSSYHASSRYSTSSSFRSEGSTGGPGDPLFEEFLDPAGPLSLFREEGPGGGPLCLPPFSRHGSRGSYGYSGSTGGAVSAHQASMEAVSSMGDSYYLSADVRQFEPHDIVVMAYNHHIFIHAEKVLDDGSVCDTFTHKSLLPEDMDPLSVSGTLSPDGVLVVRVRRTPTLGGPEPPGPPLTYRAEAHL